MICLHEHNVIYRDLQPGNAILDDKYRPFITDFGFSRFWDSKNESMSICGIPLYLAPEILLNSHYDCKVDVFSFGILMFEVVNEQQPYQEIMKQKHLNQFTLPNEVQSDARPIFNIPVKRCIKQLIQQC